MNQPKPDNKVTATFCDDSVSEETFYTDNFGNISAIDCFKKFVERAEENDRIWSPFPHVTKVHIYMPSDPTGKCEATEEFPCPCGKQKQLAGV